MKVIIFVIFILSLVSCEPTTNSNFFYSSQERISCTDQDNTTDKPETLQPVPALEETNFKPIGEISYFEMINVAGGAAEGKKGIGPLGYGTKITLSPFSIGKYEVTQQLYREVMEDSAYKVNRYGSYFEGNDYNPVERVTWYDAVYFCNRLSDRSKLERAYTMTDVVFDEGSYHIISAKVTLDLTKNGYRLPTETEWEWAARGGDPSSEVWEYDFAGSQSIDSVGWYSGNASGTTHKVGTKSPNSLKIFDMTGNVWEWVYDGYENTSGREATNPIGSENATLRIEKGGRWGSSVGECEVDYRKTNPPSFYGFCLGFRIARSGNYE